MPSQENTPARWESVLADLTARRSLFDAGKESTLQEYSPIGRIIPGNGELTPGREIRDSSAVQ